MLEFEKKVLLTEEEYNSLIENIVTSVSKTVQTNYYFDTNNFSMNKKGITYRVREKNGVYTAMVKRHLANTLDCSFEEKGFEKNEFDPKVFESRGLRCFGTLVTERTIIYEDRYCKLLLDRSFYLGCTDYELEIEYLKHAERRANNLLKSIAALLYLSKCIDSKDAFMRRVGAVKPKSQRFFEKKYRGDN